MPSVECRYLFIFCLSHFEYILANRQNESETFGNVLLLLWVVVIFFISISCHDQINRRETREIILQSILFCRWSYRIRNRFLLYRSFLSISWIDNIFRYKISSYLLDLWKIEERREEKKHKENKKSILY